MEIGDWVMTSKGEIEYICGIEGGTIRLSNGWTYEAQSLSPVPPSHYEIQKMKAADYARRAAFVNDFEAWYAKQGRD
jgi:hypothetical protein